MQWTLHAPSRNTAMRSRRTEEIAGVDQEQPTELNARSQGAVQWTLMHAPTRNTHPATRVPAVRVEYRTRRPGTSNHETAPCKGNRADQGTQTEHEE